MTSEAIQIASLFPPADEALWRARVGRVLEGRPFESLVSTTPEGLAIQPLYPRALVEGPRALRQKPGPWKISQRMDHPEVLAANQMALADLENGADALTLCIARAPDRAWLRPRNRQRKRPRFRAGWRRTRSDQPSP